jgi:hypothetical protein
MSYSKKVSYDIAIEPWNAEYWMSEYGPGTFRIHEKREYRNPNIPKSYVVVDRRIQHILGKPTPRRLLTAYAKYPIISMLDRLRDVTDSRTARAIKHISVGTLKGAALGATVGAMMMDQNAVMAGIVGGALVRWPWTAAEAIMGVMQPKRKKSDKSRTLLQRPSLQPIRWGKNFIPDNLKNYTEVYILPVEAKQCETGFSRHHSEHRLCVRRGVATVK